MYEPLQCTDHVIKREGLPCMSQIYHDCNRKLDERQDERQDTRQDKRQDTRQDKRQDKRQKAYLSFLRLLNVLSSLGILLRLASLALKSITCASKQTANMMMTFSTNTQAAETNECYCLHMHTCAVLKAETV